MTSIKFENNEQRIDLEEKKMSNLIKSVGYPMSPISTIEVMSADKPN